jgi:cytochrome c553
MKSALDRLLLAVVVGAVISLPAAAELLPVSIECPEAATEASGCKVDRDTFEGQLRYQANCLRCHGAAQEGREGKGPAIAEAASARTIDELKKALLAPAKPPKVQAHDFTHNLGVSLHIDQIHRYLELRREGRLPPGHPVMKREPAPTK